MAYYGLEEIVCIDPFVRAGDSGGRERLLVRMSEDTVELALQLPAKSLAPAAKLDVDELCQVVEGVSHFMLLAERARCDLPTTLLELELQAELDKYVYLVVVGPRAPGATTLGFSWRRLFGAARFVDPPGTVAGDRYRLAHRLAARFTRRLEHTYLRRARTRELRQTLRRFFRLGQTQKIELATAA